MCVNARQNTPPWSYFSGIFNDWLTNTVLPILSVLITLVAETLERAEAVDTLSVPAHLALEGAALIYVCKENTGRISTL